MIPLLLFCVFGGCLDAPVDNRPIYTQIWEDQLNRQEETHSCYSEGKLYENCNDRDPWGFDENEEEEEEDLNWRND